MSPKAKIWNSHSIRELARRRMDSAPASSQPTLPVSYSTDRETFRFQFGEYQEAVGERVVVATWTPPEEGDSEISLLCRTLGLQVVDTEYLLERKRPDPATLLGRGTVERLALRMKAHGAVALVVDRSVSPSQLKNIEAILQAPLLDRHSVILGIFEKHSQTRQAQLQVELAQLKYLQPRLAGIWKGLSRQRGGRGGLKGRGGGETRLELDRRTVKERIRTLTRKLADIDQSFEIQSASRDKVPRAALVGYTNAGKSTLMRALTKATVESEDLLFKTLSTTVRPLSPPTKPPVLISDTVGFIRDLPPDLVASFRSTLAEALASRLILHVVDVSHPHSFEQFATTESVLEELGADLIPRILVLNKADKLGWGAKGRLWEAKKWVQESETYKGVVLVSAQTKSGLDDLRKSLMDVLGVSIPSWAQEASEESK